MNTKTVFCKKFTSLLTLAALLAGVLIAAFPMSAQASSGSDDTPPPAQMPDPSRLEQGYQRLLEISDRQGEHLEGISERVAKIQARIDKLKADGKDTRALEEALQNYLAQVEEAKIIHAEAEAILAVHEGYDSQGKVIDAAAAKETLKSAGGKLRDAHQELRPAWRDLLKVMREFRRDNRTLNQSQP